MLARTCNIILKGTVGVLRPRSSFVTKSPSPASLTQKRSTVILKAALRLDKLNRSSFIHYRSYTSNVVKNPLFSPRDLIKGFEDSLRAYLQSLLTEVELSADHFKAQQDIVDAKHKKILGDLWKRSLAFNPLANPRDIDLRFMPHQTNDEVYQRFKSFGSGSPYILHTVRAVSGAGKTGTLLNAIGRNQYLIYMQCDFEADKDKVDLELDFINAVVEHTNLLANRGACKSERTATCKSYCTVFWLCRLMLLEAMKEKFGSALTPERWLLWSTVNGQPILRFLQEHAFKELRSLMAQYTSWLHCLDLNNMLSHYYDRHSEVWFAIDDAHVLQEYLKDDAVTITEERPSNLLDVLLLYSLPSWASKVVTSTRALYEEYEASGGAAKGSSVYKLANEDESYPYVTSEQAMKILSEWINLDGITEQNLERARHQLQGRLRYVFGFLKFLFEAARNTQITDSGVCTQRKNDIFERGLIDLKNDTDKRMKVQWKRVTELMDTKTVAEVPREALIPSFPEHMLILLADHLSQDRVTWDPDEFLKNYKITPEETGFLFFDKVEKEDGRRLYEYSIREPQLVPTLIELLMPYYPQRALQSLSEVDKDDQGQLEVKLAKCFGVVMMTPNFEHFLQKQFSGNNSWCKDLVCKWTDVNKAQSLSDIQEVIKRVRALKETAKQGQEAFFRSVSHLNKLSFFQERISKSTPEEDAALLLEIAEAADDKIGELLFMYAQPTGYLLRPSDQMGPDLIGFCTTGTGEKVLVLVSLSLLAGDHKKRLTQKEKNEYKQEPSYFYSHLPENKTKEDFIKIREVLTFVKPHETMKKIPLPKKILLLCASLPDKYSYPAQVSVDGRPQAVRIFITNSNIGDFSVGLPNMIERLMPNDD